MKTGRQESQCIYYITESDPAELEGLVYVSLEKLNFYH